MAIQVDWPNKAITVDQSDCTLVSGTFYTLDTDAFRLALKALEDNVQGITWPRTHTHNTEVTVAGTTYVRTIEIINGYTVEFLPNTLWTCQLSGSNNNIWSVGDGVLVQNSVQVIGTNSAGYITVETGVSGLTTPESDALLAIEPKVDDLIVDVNDLEATVVAEMTDLETTVVASMSALEAKIDTLLASQDLTNAQEEAEHTTSETLGKLILRNTTTMQRWEADLWEDEAQTIPYKGEGAESVGMLVEVAWS